MEIIRSLRIYTGAEVPASCIQTRIRNLRKKAASMGLVNDESPKKGNKRTAADASPQSSKKAKMLQRGATPQVCIPPSTLAENLSTEFF